jgi:ribose transport system ATP-binding protein
MSLAPTPEADVAISLRAVSMSFGGTRALADVDLDLRRGEVHALVGGNGSGKSTLIKILAGVHTAGSGTLQVGPGEPTELASHSPDAARAAGLRFVHQDLGIFEALDVAENLAIGHGYERGAGGRISWRRNHEAAREVLQKVGTDIDPRRTAATLSVAQRSMVAIARALRDTNGEAVLVLDEPTAALPPHEVSVLSDAVRRLARAGCAVLLVTHRLEEVRLLADRVTAIRDGHVVGTIEAGGLTESALVSLIVGRDLAASPPPSAPSALGKVALELADVHAGPLRGVDLQVHAGEVVGVAGLLGSGRSELLHACYGALPVTSGTVRLGGMVVRPTPARMRDRGVTLVPEDRQAEAIFPGRDVQENMTDGRLGPYFRRLLLRDRRLSADVRSDVARFKVKTPSTRAGIDQLSGGNQQKVVLARCLREEPSVLLLDEPTQGIDVGAREEIFELVADAAEHGCAVVVVSSEFEELVRLSHRVVVLSGGRIVEEHHAPVDAHRLHGRSPGMSTPSVARRRPTFISPLEVLEKYGLLVLFALVVGFFALSGETPLFSTTGNVRNVLSNQSVLGIIAIGSVLPLAAGQIDLSVGPTAGLSSVAAAGMMSKSEQPLVVAVVVGIGVGALVGVINGVLVSRFGINSIIATLGTTSVIAAVVQWYTSGLALTTGISPDLVSIGLGTWLGIPRPFYFLLGAALLVWYLLEYTPVGRYVYATGTNPRAAELVGLGVNRLVLGSFVAAGVLAGVAGVLLVAVQSGGNPQIGPTFTLPALAAAFLGATTIKPGRYNIPGALAAVFFLAFSVNGLTLWGAKPWVSDLFNGVALILAVGIAVYSGRRRGAAPTTAESS